MNRDKIRDWKDMIKQHPALYKFALVATAIPRHFITHIKYGEKRRYYLCVGGLNAHYFVIRRDGLFGIASDIIVFLGALRHMEEHHVGYEPVIDLQNYTQAISETTGEKGNAWEDFFLQPNKERVGMDAVKKARHVILGRFGERYGYPTQNNYKDLEEQGWVYYFKKYIKLRPDLEEKFLSDWQNIKPAESKVLGVKVRGTDYVELKPHNHNIQPTVEQVIEKVREFLASHDEYGYILVATEDSKVYQKFDDAFPGKLLTIGDSRIENYVGGGVTEQKNVGNQSRKALTTQYLEEMYLLAKCDSLICSLTSSLVPTLLWNGGKYEEVYLFDLGRYD